MIWLTCPAASQRSGTAKGLIGKGSSTISPPAPVCNVVVTRFIPLVAATAVHPTPAAVPFGRFRALAPPSSRTSAELCSSAFPVVAPPEKFCPTTPIRKRSPTTPKRGNAGRAIISCVTSRLDWAAPTWAAAVIALASSRQVVKLSGRLMVTVAWPSASVVRVAFQ